MDNLYLLDDLGGRTLPVDQNKIRQLQNILTKEPAAAPKSIRPNNPSNWLSFSPTTRLLSRPHLPGSPEICPVIFALWIELIT